MKAKIIINEEYDKILRKYGVRNAFIKRAIDPKLFNVLHLPVTSEECIQRLHDLSFRARNFRSFVTKAFVWPKGEIRLWSAISEQLSLPDKASKLLTKN